MEEGEEIQQMIIEICEKKDIYIFKVSKDLMPDFQKAIIEGTRKKI